MRELIAQELADRRKQPTVRAHDVGERDHRAVGAEDPDEIEAAQGVQRHQTLR